MYIEIRFVDNNGFIKISKTSFKEYKEASTAFNELSNDLMEIWCRPSIPEFKK